MPRFIPRVKSCNDNNLFTLVRSRTPQIIMITRIHCSFQQLYHIWVTLIIQYKRQKVPCLNHCTVRLVPCTVQSGTEGDDYFITGGVASDGSVVLAGYTTGAYAAENAGSDDFVVIKLDDYGKVLWTWQVRDRFARPSFCPACVHGSFFHQWLAVIIFVMKVNQWSMMIEAAFVLNTRIEMRNLYRRLLRRTCCHCSVCLPPWAPMFDGSRTVPILRTDGMD